MLCDDTGSVVVPVNRAGEVLEVACKADKVEQRILALLGEPVTMREARAQIGLS